MMSWTKGALLARAMITTAACAAPADPDRRRRLPATVVVTAPIMVTTLYEVSNGAYWGARDGLLPSTYDGAIA